MRVFIRLAIFCALAGGAYLCLANPFPGPGHMTGAGTFYANGPVGPRILTHNFELHCDAATTPNHLDIYWGRDHFQLDHLDSAACYNTGTPPDPPVGFTTLFGSGPGTINGRPGAYINFGFADHGAGNTDVVNYIVLTNSSGFVFANNPSSVFLTSGNHQAHVP